MKECSTEGCIRPVFAGGMCSRHYDAMRRSKAPPCMADGCSAPQHALGLCDTHYRSKRQATRPDKCKVVGCERAVTAHGLCQAHYMRSRKHGHIDPTRAHDWGGRSAHPLYETWSWLRRKKGQAKAHEDWMNDFWLFAKEIGEKPSPLHVLRRRDKSEPHRPGNSYWAAVQKTAIQASNKKEYMRLWHKQYRANNPEKHRNYELKRRIGCSAEEFDAMYKKQNGLCAICGQPEARLNPVTQQPRAMAVDHCHTSGKIRGLLCTYHNTGLGLFNDDPELLRKAIAYLESHAA